MVNKKQTQKNHTPLREIVEERYGKRHIEINDLIIGILIIIFCIGIIMIPFFIPYDLADDGKCYDKNNNEIIGQTCDTSITFEDKFMAHFLFSMLGVGGILFTKWIFLTKKRDGMF